MKIDELKLEITRWTKREAELVHQKHAIEAEAGSAMVDAEPGAGKEGKDRLERALTELRAAEVALKTARQRRIEAVHAKHAAEIEGLESRRMDLEKKQAALSAKVERHKKELAELLGIEVVILPAMAGRPSTLQTLGLQITGVGDQIERLQKPLKDSGMLDVENAGSTDPLIEALGAFDGVIPNMERVLAWADSCEPVPGDTFGDLPRTFRLTWNAGEIDPQQSYIIVNALRGAGFESDMFRARKASLKPAVF